MYIFSYISGVLFDITGNWKQSFYQAAVWTVLSGLLIGLIPYSKNRKLIGEGPVEKEIEESENKVITIVLLVVVIIILTVFVLYLTAVSLLQP